MKNIFFVVLLLAIVFQNLSFAQEDGSTKRTQSDYEKMIPDVLKTIEWLETTPVEKNASTRKDLNAVLLTFASGYSGVRVDINGFIASYGEVNPNFIMMFIAGCVKYQLTNKTKQDKENEVMVNEEGLKSIAKLYKLGGIKKSELLDNLIKAEEEGKLSDIANEKIKSE